MRKKLKKQKPVDLPLTKIQFPITAISSIAHRISGVIIFFFLGFLLWLLNLSLSSPEGFNQIKAIINGFIPKFFIWNCLSILGYHIVSGIRYMLMDFGYIKETLITAVRSSQIVFVISVIFSVLAGVFLW